jgi:hypothetical protein
MIVVEIAACVLAVVIAGFVALGSYTRRGQSRGDPTGWRTVVSFEYASSGTDLDATERVSAGAREIASRLAAAMVERGVVVDGEVSEGDFGWGFPAIVGAKEGHVEVAPFQDALRPFGSQWSTIR